MKCPKCGSDYAHIRPTVYHPDDTGMHVPQALECTSCGHWRTLPHVWIVGFPRCGTASLCEALRILGWNPIHNPRNWDHFEGRNAAGDVMVTAHWKELLAMYPRSKLILNTRSYESWVESLKRIPGFWTSPLVYDRYYRQRVYRGVQNPRLENPVLKQVWEDHHEEVIREVPESRLLVMALPFDWSPLCEFLGMSVPTAHFPWCNKGMCRDVVVRLKTGKAELV